MRNHHKHAYFAELAIQKDIHIFSFNNYITCFPGGDFNSQPSVRQSNTLTIRLSEPLPVDKLTHKYPRAWEMWAEEMRAKKLNILLRSFIYFSSIVM